MLELLTGLVLWLGFGFWSLGFPPVSLCLRVRFLSRNPRFSGFLTSESRELDCLVMRETCRSTTTPDEAVWGGREHAVTRRGSEEPMTQLTSGGRHLPKLVAAVLGAILCAGLLHAWEFEQVDTAGPWAMVRIQRTPSGQPYLVYNDSVTHRMHIAWRDSIWHRDTLPFSSDWFDFKIGPRGRMGVTLGDGRYAELTDTGWFATHIHPELDAEFLAFDSNDDPAVTVFDGLNLLLFQRRDTVWRFMGAAWIGGMPHDALDGVYGLDFDRLGRISTFFAYEYGYHMPIQRCLTALGWAKGGERFNVAGLSQTPLADSGMMICYNMGPPDSSMSFYCGHDRIEPEGASTAVVRADTWNHLHLVYKTGSLTYAYKSDTFWHKETIPGCGSTGSFDLAIDNSSGPILAMIRPSGICVADRPFAEVAESEARADLQVPELGILPNPAGQTAELSRSSPGERQMPFRIFDLTGRTVAHGILRRGQQHAQLDLCTLTPGLYFVVPEGHPVSRVKLVLTGR